MSFWVFIKWRDGAYKTTVDLSWGWQVDRSLDELCELPRRERDVYDVVPMDDPSIDHLQAREIIEWVRRKCLEMTEIST